jgi:hypothetical protein
MKTLVALLALSFAAGEAFAGEGMSVSSSYQSVRRIPPDVVLGIKRRAVYQFPSQPDLQVVAIAEGVEAYFELKKVPGNPAKSQAAADFPYNYPKQLYLAQRGFLHAQSVGGSEPSYW